MLHAIAVVVLWPRQQLHGRKIEPGLISQIFAA
jgi:hypothetical protein